MHSVYSSLVAQLVMEYVSKWQTENVEQGGANGFLSRGNVGAWRSVCTSPASMREWLTGRTGDEKRTKGLHRHSRCLPSVASPRVTHVTKTSVNSVRVAACWVFIIVIGVGSP